MSEQDCARKSDKCAIVQDGAGVRAAACIARTGDRALGESCVRGPLGFGHDDCAAGAFCSFIGELGPDQGGTRRCHALCTSDRACADGERCGVLVESQGAGFCGPSCQPFSACGPGLSCADVYDGTAGLADVWLACRPIGAAASGANCTTSYECPADHACIDPAFGNARRCLALCDSAHACSSGSCRMFGAFGFCG